MLKSEFSRWQNIIDGLTESQIHEPQLDENWSIKDVIAHLWAWQLRSIARLEATVMNQEPHYPDWPEQFDPEVEGQPHDLNAWLYQTYRNKAWADVYADWRTGFLHLINLSEQIPETDLLEKDKYAWLEGYTLADVLTGTIEHHEEHRVWLMPYLEDGS